MSGEGKHHVTAPVASFSVNVGKAEFSTGECHFFLK